MRIKTITVDVDIDKEMILDVIDDMDDADLVDMGIQRIRKPRKQEPHQHAPPSVTELIEAWRTGDQSRFAAIFREFAWEVGGKLI